MMYPPAKGWEGISIVFSTGALRGPGFYECVKCLVDTLNLIYDYNNNGASSLSYPRQQPRENEIWRHKAWEGNFIS